MSVVCLEKEEATVHASLGVRVGDVAFRHLPQHVEHARLHAAILPPTWPQRPTVADSVHVGQSRIRTEKVGKGTSQEQVIF
jgi:hypothetical protein